MCCQEGYEGFEYFCRNYVKIQDKETARAVPFEFFPCQAATGKKLAKKRWLRILKARRLGFTWLLAAYCTWLCMFFSMQTIAYIVHKREFAGDFIRYCKFIYARLPDWLRQPVSAETMWRMDFDQNGHGSWIRALAATPGSADSLAVNVGIVDEGTKIERLNPGLLKDIYRSLEPTVETSKGFVVQISTSEGPTGDFFDGWKAAEKGQDRYENVFFGWKARPGRTRKWYNAEAGKHSADPTFMLRQYPETVEQAFAHAEGRIYSRFATATHVARCKNEMMEWEWGEPKLAPEGEGYLGEDWLKYRAIDWGGVDPYVCLWLAKIPGNPSALTVDPACPNTIREFQAYRRRADSEYIIDRDNHAMDAIRYAVVTFFLQGHIHIYREMYIPNSAAKGLDLPSLAMQVKEMSGDETYAAPAVADASRSDNIITMNRNGVQCIAHNKKPAGGTDTKTHQVEQGIVRVNTLIIGNHDLWPRHDVDPDVQAYMEKKKKYGPHDPHVSVGLAEHRETKQLVQRLKRRPELLRAPARSRRVRVRKFK